MSSNDVITLCLDRDTTLWNGNEKWIEVDKVAAANGAGSYTFNLTGFAPGTYYVGGYMYDKTLKTFTNSHLMQSVIIGSGSSQLQSSSSLSVADSNNNSVAADDDGLVDGSSNSTIMSKDVIFSSGGPAPSVYSQPITDATGPNDEDQENILAQTDASQESAAIDRVLQDQDAWLDRTSGNWPA